MAFTSTNIIMKKKIISECIHIKQILIHLAYRVNEFFTIILFVAPIECGYFAHMPDFVMQLFVSFLVKQSAW